MTTVVLALAALVILFLAWHWIRARVLSRESLVLLRSCHRPISEAEARAAFRRAFGHEAASYHFFADAAPGSAFHTLVSDDIPPLRIITYPSPRFSPAAARSMARSPRVEPAGDALIRHTAWIAVYGMNTGRISQEARLAFYPVLSRLAAEFLDDDCLGIYLTAENRALPIDSNTLEELRRGRVAVLAGHDSPFAGHLAAMFEAKSRLPELAGAFAACGSASSAIVAFVRLGTDEGASWLTVEEVDGDEITGVVLGGGNGPALVPGERLSIRRKDIVDWTFVNPDGSRVGPFASATFPVATR